MTILVVPPPNLVLIALAGLVVMRWRWYRRAGMIIVTASLVLLLVLSLPVTGQSLLVSLEQGLPLTPPADAPPQAIVILSAEVEHTVGPGPDVRVGPLTLQRLRAGAALYRRTHLPILVSGGTLQTDEPPIADLMADSLKNDFGVPVRWVEAQSRDTWENASNSAAVLAPLGIHSVYVVTHAWHEKRALIAFRSFWLAGHRGAGATGRPLRWPAAGNQRVGAQLLWAARMDRHGVVLVTGGPEFVRGRGHRAERDG